MRTTHLRTAVGLTVIATHIIAFIGIVGVRAAYFVPDIRLDLAMMLLPVSAVYVVAIVKAAIREKGVKSEGSRVNLNYVVIVGIMTLAFCGALLMFVYGFPAIGGPHTDDLRRWLVVLEIAFGSTFGLIAEDLFGKIERTEAEGVQAASPL